MGKRFLEADEMPRLLQVVIVVCAIVCMGIGNFLAIRVVESLLGSAWYVPGFGLWRYNAAMDSWSKLAKKKRSLDWNG